MGSAQSHADFFQPTQRQDLRDGSDEDGIDPLALLYKVERRLWRKEPAWLKPPPRSQRRVNGVAPSESVGESEAKASTPIATGFDPMGSMSASQALAFIPTLMDEKWVAPLLALIDSADAVIQSTGLALLASIIRSDTAEDVFLKVGGIAKVMALMEVESMNVKYLALEVIHAICSRNARLIAEFCKRELVYYLTELASLDATQPANPGIILAALKVLRQVLADGPTRQLVSSSHTIMPLLLTLTQSPDLSVAQMAVQCVGLSLSEPANMSKIIQLGCVDTLLKLVLPPNPNPCAVVQALSLISDEDPTLFPKDLTLLTVAKILDTLRGGAKRSRTAGACAYLFASLVKSPVLRDGLCTESNLSILSKLLVGGSQDVLKAATFAIGMVAFEGSNTTKEVLFSVHAPENLLKLLDCPSDQELTRLLLFAMGSLLDPSTILDSGGPYRWGDSEKPSKGLQKNMRGLCKSVVEGSDRYDTVLQYAVSQISCASTFAAKIVCSTCSTSDTRLRVVANKNLVLRLCAFLTHSAPDFLSSLLLFFVECSSMADQMPDNSVKFCELVSDVDGQLDSFAQLFDLHEPLHLAGLLTAFRNFAAQSSSLRIVLSTSRIIEYAMSLLTKVRESPLHVEVLSFLNEITSAKNQAAVANIFAQSPDRVANLVYSQQEGVLLPTLNIMRRMFKHHNHHDAPSSGARRQLAMMLCCEEHTRAVAAARVWGNLLLHRDKRNAFGMLPNAVESLLRLIRKCSAQFKDGLGRSPVANKNCLLVIRALCRGVQDCEQMKKETACAPSFLVVFDLFDDADEGIMKNAVATATEIAKVRDVKKSMVVPSVLQKLAILLGNRDLVTIGPVYRVCWLRYVSALCRRDDYTQRTLEEFGVVDAILLLAQSPAATLDLDVLKECLETLAWLCTGEATVRIKIASTPKLLDLALRYIDCPRTTLITACFHLLQRITSSDDCNEQKTRFRVAGGSSIVMRAIHAAAGDNAQLAARAFALVRNIVTHDDINKSEFQRLGFDPVVVRAITPQGSQVDRKVILRGLQAIAAMSSGTSSVSKACKLETLESENAHELLHLVEEHKEPKLSLAWCEATLNLIEGSSQNQKKLVDSGLTSVVVQLMGASDSPTPRLQITAARLLACMASLAENRPTMMTDGGDTMISAIVAGLQSDVHDVQRYVALLIAHLATRNDSSKIRIGAGATTGVLIDRLSSKQLNVIENVLQAMTKLGTHAGNKVKFGSRVCFEKLLALVHHDELAIRKGAVSTIAVLIEGNDVNKKYLLQSESSVITDLCALMKSSNGKIVESAMLILGELSQLADQTLEISKFIDVVGIVRMVEHVNPRIRRAALHTALNLTKESFNKLRFGIDECINAMLSCLQSEDMLIVELAMTCLANLSFLESNASKIAKHGDSIGVFLKLAAASTASKDYLSWNEARSLGLERVSRRDRASPKQKSAPSPSKDCAQCEPGAIDLEGVDEEEIDDKLEPFVYSTTQDVNPDSATSGNDIKLVLDFTSFPTRQTSVLEQTLLVLSNCAQAYHIEQAVEKVGVKVVCQALSHPSELVKRCACYVLAVWCKKDTKNQRYTTKQGILPVLIQLLNSPNLNVVEAAIFVLGKLAYYGDNHMKLLHLDLLTTLVQTILRKPANLTHEGLMDRTIRILGTLARFPRVRQTIKSEEIIADILTQLLQIHRPLAKNTSRLILAMLEEDSLRFFLPKKTVMILRVFLTDNHGASPKTIRNILCVFQRIATVEEHKTTIALEDSGEALMRMIQELCPIHKTQEESRRPDPPPNSQTVLSLLACISSTRKIAMILHERDLYAVLPLYLMTESATDDSDTVRDPATTEQIRLYANRAMVRDALVIARHMCSTLGDRASSRLSQAQITRLLVDLLCVLQSTTDATDIIPEYFECFVILDRLSGYARDQQYFAESRAAEVVLRFLQQWMAEAERDGTVEGRQETRTNQDHVDLVAYVAPIIRVLLRMAENDMNKVIVVRSGGIPALLRCLDYTLLSDELRLLLARAMRLLCAVRIASDWFDGQDLVMPLFWFMHKHRHQPELRLNCLGCLADILETSVLSRRHVIGQPQVLMFLLQCLQNAVDESPDQVHFAINALECMSMEPELAQIMSQLDEGLLELVSGLLLVSDEVIARSTQYFAIEMLGYMASYGYADKLGLDAVKIGRILRFLDFTADGTLTGESIALTLWTLAHLVRRQPSSASRTTYSVSAAVTEWIVTTEGGIDLIICAGLTPSDQLGTNSSVTANTLSVLLAVCTSERVPAVVHSIIQRHRTMCTSLSAHLEAVEREVNLPALRLLAICLEALGREGTSTSSLEGSTHPGGGENWSVIFRHLMEWMEVFARDPDRCPAPSLSDAFVCLSHITTVQALAGEFRSSINRSGLAEIVANVITYLDPSRRSLGSEHKIDDTEERERRHILSNALKICGNLMEFTPAYSERFFLLNVPQSIENALMVDDDEVIVESLVCMSLLAEWSSNRQLLFSSMRCVCRLVTLLRHESVTIAARITPLLVLMCSRVPSLPGLCTVEGIRILCERLSLVTDWRNRDRYLTRVTEDCATIILSVFSNEDSIIVIFDEVDVVGEMFDIVQKRDAPEIPLRILTKMSSSAHSHTRFLRLLSPMCQLLEGTTRDLASSPQHLVLCILFNLICRADDPEVALTTLKMGEEPVLRQLLPLARWVSVQNVASVRIVIKIIHTYVSSACFRRLLNDGKNIPALLKLVADPNEDVSGAAAQLSLTAIGEREVEIAITVEDGIAVLIRTLQKTSKWHLQCLLLAILRNMCHDAEIPVLIVNEDGVSRLVHFIRERKGALFAADERLAHACKILRYVSAITTPGTAKRIVDVRGHIRLIELFTHQETATNDSERATTMEILSNMAFSGEVGTQLTEGKFHDQCLRWVVAQPSSSETGLESLPQSRKLALYGLRCMCKHSKNARQDTATTATSKSQFIDQLERWLDFGTSTGNEVDGVAVNALAVLMYLSKTQIGRHSIYANSSPRFIARVCAIVMAAQDQTDSRTTKTTDDQQAAQSTVLVLGVKLLGNLLSDLTPERFRVTWVCSDLVNLLALLQRILGDHQRSKLQLHALDVLSGSYDGDFYFPVSTQMLSDVINLLLISPTPRHSLQAERVIIKAFEREDRIQAVIGGNQVLEQMLILFAQRVEYHPGQPQQRRPLAPALTQVLNVSMARGFIVNPRFTSKIVTLLGSSALASKADAYTKTSVPRFTNPSIWSSDDDDDDALAAALAVYLGFVFKASFATGVSERSGHASPSVFQLNIRETFQSEVNAPALTTLLLLLLSMHEQVCLNEAASLTPITTANDVSTQTRSPVSGRRESRRLSQRDLLMWNLVSHCLRITAGSSYPQHIVALLQDVPHAVWLCMLEDIFSQLASYGETSVEQDRTFSGSIIHTGITSADTTIEALHVLSVIAALVPPTEDHIDARVGLGRWCFHSILGSASNTSRSSSLHVLDEALNALASIRTGWGDEIVIMSFQKVSGALRIIEQWLQIFRDPDPLLSHARESTLQLFLLFVSSGTGVEELKAADIRGSIENNEFIPAALKSVAISILSLLGYNADLNAEFQLAIDRFSEATAFSQRREALSYLTNFLQLYTLTDEVLQEVAIDQCMRRLVDDTNSIVRESNQPGGGSGDELMDCIRDYLICLSKLSNARNFSDLYMRQWNTNALLAVCFSRRRAVGRGGLRECAVLSIAQITSGLDICAKITDTFSAATSAGTLSDTTFMNAMALLDDLSQDQMVLCERVVALLAWGVENEDTFDLLCNFASRLRSVLRCVTSLSDAGVQSLFTILDTLTKRVPEIELLGDLLTELLTCVYRNASKLKNGVREKMLLYILVILKRMGEDGLSACTVFEQSIQVILANVHVQSEMPARCSWDLLGVLSELDPAIVTIFNFDGIPIILKEFCGPTSAAPSRAKGLQPPPSPVRRVLSTRQSALGGTDRAALAASAAIASEAMYRRLEALKCLSKAARNHDEVLQKIGETLGIGAHLFRVVAGSANSLGNFDVDAAPVVTSAAQEHAAHLIARISSQELFRASLLSQDHVSTLIESLESVHPRIVLHALEALFYLSEFAMCLDALVRHATVPVLAQILVSPLVEGGGSTQQNTELFVLGLLANMCAKSKVIGRRVVSSNLLPRLRTFLRSSRPQVQFYAVWVIKSVSKDEELVAKLHEQRIAEVLGEVLLSYEPLKTQRKAFGALCNMIAGHRIGAAFVDDDAMCFLTRTVVQAMHPLVVSSQPTAHRSLARALTVLGAIASLSQRGKEMLDDENVGEDARAIPLVLQLLDSIHSGVKLKALQVISHWVEENADRDKLRRVLLVEAPLLSLVRAISDSSGESLLVALTLLNTLLAIDDELKTKLSSMTNEVLLRLLPTLVPMTPAAGTSPLTPIQLRAVNEAVKSLVAMARGLNGGGMIASANHATVIENAIDPLVELLRLSTASDSLRLNAIYLLVTFAGSTSELRPKMLTHGTMAAFIRVVTEPHDDKLLQLCLLGMALLTSNAVDFSCVVSELLGVVDVLLRCLTSKNTSVQANAVWVVSNICVEDRLKEAIVSRGGATTLQAVLNETVSEAASRGGSTPVNTGTSRPLSSSQRIREYAPKAIKSLGFAPMAPTLSK